MPKNEDIRCVARALDLLQLLSISPKGMTLWGIRSVLQVDAATGHRLIKTMIHKGFVEKLNGVARYALSSDLYGLRYTKSRKNADSRYHWVNASLSLVRSPESTGDGVASNRPPM